MKKTCLILAAVCMLMAIAFLALSLTVEQEKPLVSQMSDREIDRFMSRYGLENLKSATSYDLIRSMAREFEETGVIINMFSGMDYRELISALTAALRRYYGIGLPLGI